MDGRCGRMLLKSGLYQPVAMASLDAYGPVQRVHVVGEHAHVVVPVEPPVPVSTWPLQPHATTPSDNAIPNASACLIMGEPYSNLRAAAHSVFSRRFAD